MASRQQNLKRKSEDFIYEVDENDLSADESVEDKKTKMQKIDSDVEKTSKISCPNLVSGKFIEENKVETQMKSITQTVTSTKEADESKNSEISQSLLKNCNATDGMKIVEVNCTVNEEISDVIDINDSDIENSVVIVENDISVVELSDEENLKSSDVTQEEGEILDVFEVVDEIGPTPKIEQNEVQVVTEVQTDDSIMSISFKSEEVKNCYQNKIIKFLSTFPEFEVFSEELCINIIKKTAINEVHSDSLIHKTPKKKHKKKKAKKELFILDTNPSLDDSTVGLRYSSKYSIEDKKPEEESCQKKIASVQACFNCGEGHALKDCTVPKDFNKINAARQKFASNKNKSTRYHVEEDQKFGHLKPGVISEKLRRALGLKKGELPSYIYGMRALGYPPGWLEEAKIVHSSLRLFNIDGGKVKNNNKIKNRGLDPDKIIDYPGFNAPMEKGFNDDFRKYRVNPYSKKLEKHIMLKHFENMVEEDGNDSETSDIELDESQEMKNTEAGKILDQTSWSCNSSSLLDLENHKKILINQLNTSNITHQLNDSNSQNDESDGCESGEEEKPIIAIKESTLGTPIIKTGSPYMHLPNADNFTVGVSPVIDFENLPNSTGKYEQMSGVLSKVRSTMKNLEGGKS